MQTGATVAGPVPLPTRRRVYCVLRSPHVNKNSMEHFQVLTHQRLIDLKNPTAQTIDALMQLDLPAGERLRYWLWGVSEWPRRLSPCSSCDVVERIVSILRLTPYPSARSDEKFTVFCLQGWTWRSNCKHAL